MKKTPLLSIITVCLNEPKLERTCESIINQTYQDFEWIVIDGGSNQETLNVLENYKYRMNFFVSEKDQGIYYAMNKGIDQAIGERLNFLNSGDWYASPGILQNVKEFMTQFHTTDVLHGIIKTHDNRFSFSTDEIVMLKYSWIVGSVIPHPATFYKRDVFEKFGKYRTDYKIVSDYVFNLKLMFNGKCSFKHIDCLVANFSEPGASNQNNPLHVEERKKVINEFFPQEISILEEEKKYRILLNHIKNKSMMLNLRNNLIKNRTLPKR